MAIANAVIECPDGNENWSGGNRLAQQCGSRAHARLRPAVRLRIRNTATPSPTDMAAAAIALKRSLPPNSKTAAAIGDQSQPSPPRVAQIIHNRIQCGACHLWTRLIRL